MKRICTFSAALVAYAFARLRFRGSNWLFLLVLATMMVPYQVTMVPRFLLFRELGWFGFIEMLIFLAVLALGLWYVWAKGALDWNTGGPGRLMAGKSLEKDEP